MATAALADSAAAVADPAAAQDDSAPPAGTCLAQKEFEPGTDPNTVGRSLLALSGGGVAAWTDSNAGGGDGWQAFTEARGGWTCDGERFAAVVLDFTHETAEMPGQQIARIDVALAIAEGRVEGDATILLFSLGGDGSDTASGGSDIRFALTARMVTP